VRNTRRLGWIVVDHGRLVLPRVEMQMLGLERDALAQCRLASPAHGSFGRCARRGAGDVARHDSNEIGATRTARGDPYVRITDGQSPRHVKQGTFPDRNAHAGAEGGVRIVNSRRSAIVAFIPSVWLVYYAGGPLPSKDSYYHVGVPVHR
jgi:hypothetical protein